MPRPRKTSDTWQLWINYGQGWEHEITEDTRREAKTRLREYRENCPQYPVRLRYRRERIEARP
jgi:hypothetical protein